METRIRSVEIGDMEIVREWRNKQREILRTPFVLTESMQKRFYYSVICNRESNNRFYSLIDKQGTLIAMIGLENIQWQNRIAEISIINEADCHHILEIGVEKILGIAFNELNLKAVFTEVYECSRYKGTWNILSNNKKAYQSFLPTRKYHNGIYYASTIHTFTKMEDI